jgi:hypothetical protein
MRNIYEWLLMKSEGYALLTALKLLLLVACLLNGASSDADAPLIGP